jgi:hypothetical protein
MNKLHQVHPEVYDEMSRRMDSPYMWAEFVKLSPDEQITLLKKIRDRPERVPVRLVKRLVRAALEATAEERTRLMSVALHELEQRLKLLEYEKMCGSALGKREHDCLHPRCKLHYKIDYEKQRISWMPRQGT